MKDEVLRETFTNREALSGTLEERLAYEARLKRVLDDETKIVEAEMRGEERGIEQGEQKQKEGTARFLLAQGLDFDLIMGATGLSKERIQELNKK